MRNLYKVILGILLAAIVVVILAAVLLVKVVNPNDFKQEISQVVLQQTGRTLTMQGDIKWRFFPWLGLRVSKVTLSNPKGFAVANFAKVGEADIEVRLLPLLGKHLQIGRLVLHGANLHLIKEASGKNNWQDLLESKDSGASKSLPATNKKGSLLPDVAKIGALPFVIGNIDIVNSNVSYQDRVTGKNFTVQDFNFRAKDISLSSPFDIRLGFIFASSKPAVSSKVKLNATLSFDMKDQLYALQDFHLQGSYKDATLKSAVNFNIAANVIADLKKQFITMGKLNVNVANLRAQGLLKGERILDAPSFTGKLTVNLNKVNNLLALFKTIQPLKQDINHAALAFNVQASPKFAKINNITANLDDARLNGQINVANFNNPNIDFSLKINKLNADRYAMVDRGTNVNKSATKSKVKTDAEQNFADVVALPAMFNMQGDLKVASMQLAKLALKNVDLHMRGKNRVIKFDKINADLYQGTLRSTATIDVTRAVPSLQMQVALTNIALKPLLQNTADTEKLSGTSNVEMNVSSSGNDMDAILRNINGQGKFSILNGVWDGVDVRYQIGLANSTLNKSAKPKESNPPRTEFGKLTGSFVIQNGLLRNNDLLVDSPDYRVTGRGTLNLPQQFLDYRLEAMGMKNKEPTNFAVPIAVTGPLSNPQIRPDMANLLKNAATRALTDPITDNKLVKSLKLNKLFN